MQNNPRLGIMLMIATTFIFAVQDGISRHLAGEYNVIMIVMIRYWFFAAFVISHRDASNPVRSVPPRQQSNRSCKSHAARCSRLRFA